MNGCPFCALAAGEDPDLIVLRTPRVLVVPVLRQRRRNRGHMLVVPGQHLTRLVDAEPEAMAELYSTAARVSMAVREAFGATGATLFQNDDAPGQLLLHLHVHVVPRKAGDGFTMPDPQIDELSLEERRSQAVALRSTLLG